MDSWLKQARVASGLTAGECAACLQKSVEAYAELERRPGMLRLNEVAALLRVLDADGRRIAKAALQGL